MSFVQENSYSNEFTVETHLFSNLLLAQLLEIAKTRFK